MTINPWDVPPFPAEGSDETELYAAIGRALTGWELFEIGFASMFGFLVGARKRLNTPAVRAYGAVITFRGRLEMVQAAAQVYFLQHPQAVLEARCKALISDAGRYSPRRNEIAHGIVQMYGVVLRRKPFDKYVLTASWYASNKRALKRKDGLLPHLGDPRYIYSVEEIRAFSDQFRALAESAIKLGNDIHWKRARPDSDYIPK